MIISALKPCCYTCHCPDIEVDNTDYYFPSKGEDRLEDRQATISCAHMNVCKYYNVDMEEDS